MCAALHSCCAEAHASACSSGGRSSCPAANAEGSVSAAAVPFAQTTSSMHVLAAWYNMHVVGIANGVSVTAAFTAMQAAVLLQHLRSVSGHDADWQPHRRKFIVAFVLCFGTCVGLAALSAWHIYLLSVGEVCQLASAAAMPTSLTARAHHLVCQVLRMLPSLGLTIPANAATSSMSAGGECVSGCPAMLTCHASSCTAAVRTWPCRTDAVAWCLQTTYEMLHKAHHLSHGNKAAKKKDVGRGFAANIKVCAFLLLL